MTITLAKIRIKSDVSMLGSPKEQFLEEDRMNI